jgi:hypothetical protein
MPRLRKANGPTERGLADLVYQELVALRFGVGLTAARVKKKAPRTQQLNCVVKHLTLHPQQSSESAAENVIKCAVGNYPLNPTFRRILVHTLNIDQGGDEQLQVRRAELMEDLGVLNESNYKTTETKAYQELVSVLISLDESPCREFGMLPVQELLKMAADEVRVRSDETITIEIPVGPIVEVLLRWMVDETQFEQLLRQQDAFLELLPRLAGFARRFRGAELIHDLVRRITEFAPGQFDVEEGFLSPRLSHYLFLKQLPEGATKVEHAGQVSEARGVATTSFQRITDYVNFGPSWLDFYEQKRNTVRFLSDSIATFELTDQWSRLYEGWSVQVRSDVDR